jgi:hypothetical protein
MSLSNLRTAVADANGLVDKGDLAPREPASRILINSGTAPWPAGRRPSRVGVIDRAITAGSIALSQLFDHIGQMRPWATKRSRISSPSSIRCAEKIKRTLMEDAYDRRLHALWPSNTTIVVLV